MPYARRIRRSTVKRAARRTTRRAKYNTGDKSVSWGKGAKSVITQRSPAFSKNLGSALHVDRPLVEGGAFPATMFTKLRYSQQLILYTDNLTNRTGSEVAFRLGSLFDPDFTTTGHQPLGFDQLAAIYKLYRVYKVDIQVRVTGRFGSGVTFVVAGVRSSLASYQLGGLKSGQEVIEQPANTVLDAALNQTWEQSYYLADIEGISRQRLMTDDQYNSSVTTNPYLTPYLALAAGTWDEPASASNGAYVVVNFVFHAAFSGPQPLPVS